MPHFRAFLDFNVHLNNVHHLVEVRSNALSVCVMCIYYKLRAVRTDSLFLHCGFLVPVHGLVQVRRNVVSHVNGQPMTMVVPSAGIWGTAGIDGLNIDRNIPGRWSRRMILHCIRFKLPQYTLS